MNETLNHCMDKLCPMHAAGQKKKKSVFFFGMEMKLNEVGFLSLHRSFVDNSQRLDTHLFSCINMVKEKDRQEKD